MVESSTLLSSLPQRYRSGDVIADKYRLERVLGEGGQACVWRARNLSLDLAVALKIVRLGSREEGQAERLLREARTAAQLQHPAIVRVFDIGQTPYRDPFLVMELLEGESLARKLMRSARLAPEEALRILLPIAEAARAAHLRGVVHRDIKPENVFITRSGDELQPKLLDFGVAKVSAACDRVSQLTRVGAVVGSPAYLSPEQARGEPDMDQRADIWSLAATLYQCMTGQLPFRAATYNALLRAIIEDEPAPITDFGVGDSELWEIIRRGLAKPREARWGSMEELGAALAQWLVQRGVESDICGAPLALKWLRVESGPPRPAPESVTDHPSTWELSAEQSGARPVPPWREQAIPLAPVNSVAPALPAPVAAPAVRERRVPVLTLTAAFLAGVVGVCVFLALPRFPARFTAGDGAGLRGTQLAQAAAAPARVTPILVVPATTTSSTVPQVEVVPAEAGSVGAKPSASPSAKVSTNPSQHEALAQVRTQSSETPRNPGDLDLLNPY